MEYSSVLYYRSQREREREREEKEKKKKKKKKTLGNSLRIFFIYKEKKLQKSSDFHKAQCTSKQIKQTIKKKSHTPTTPSNPFPTTTNPNTSKSKIKSKKENKKKKLFFPKQKMDISLICYFSKKEKKKRKKKTLYLAAELLRVHLRVHHALSHAACRP